MKEKRKRKIEIKEIKIKKGGTFPFFLKLILFKFASDQKNRVLENNNLKFLSEHIAKG